MKKWVLREEKGLELGTVGGWRGRGKEGERGGKIREKTVPFEDGLFMSAFDAQEELRVCGRAYDSFFG